MRKEVGKGILLIALFLSLIVNSALAQGQFLRVGLPHGADDIPGIARGQDTIVLEANASLPSSPVTGNMLRVFRQTITSSSPPQEVGRFQSCTQGTCIFEEPASQLSGSWIYTVGLFEGQTQRQLSRPRILTVDREPPTFTDVDITALVSQQVPVSFAVRDLSGGSGCVGVKDVTITVDGSVVHTESINTDNCATVRRTVPVIFSQTNEPDVCLTATDHFNQVSQPQCQRVSVDRSPPSIRDVRIIDERGNDVSFIGPRQGGQAFAVSATIEDDHLDVGSIQADFSSWNNGLNDTFPDDQLGTTFFWENQFFDLNNLDRCAVGIRAGDALGNQRTETIFCGVRLDDIPPVSPTLVATHVLADDNTPIVVPGGKLTIDIEEFGTGMNDAAAFLDLSQIGGRSVRRAESCVERNDKWRCSWTINPQVGNGRYTVLLTEQTRDDGGAHLVNDHSFEVLVDTTLPAITNLTVEPLFPTVTSGLDVSFLIVNHPQFQPDDIVMDITEFEEIGAQPSCTQISPGNWHCTHSFAVPHETAEGTLHMELTYAGRVISFDETVTGYAVINEDAVGFDISRLELIPETIDPRVLRSVDYPVMLRIKLFQLANDVSIATQSISCDRMDLFLSGRPYLVNEPGLEQLAVLPIVAHESNDANIPIDCDLHMQLRRDDAIFAEPQVLQLQTNLVKDDQLIDPDVAVSNRLQSIRDDIDDLDKDVEKWRKISKLLTIESALAVGINSAALVTEILLAITWGYLMLMIAALTSLLGPLAALPIAGVNAAWVGPCLLSSTARVVFNALWPVGPIGTVSPLKLGMMVGSCNTCGYEDNVVVASPPLEASMKVTYGAILGTLYAGPLGFVAGGVLTSFAGTRSTDMAPDKSIHFASKCLCPEGIAYNLEKEKQLKCRQRNCIQKHQEQGLPITTCDVSYKDANCLYVDSATYKLGRRHSSFFNSITGSMIDTGIVDALGLAWWGGCIVNPVALTSAWVCAPAVPANFMMPICGVWGRSVALTESVLMMENKYDWESKFSDLDQNNFCNSAGDTV